MLNEIIKNLAEYYDIEKAIFINNESDLSFCDLKFSRIYYGSEFCEHRMPDSASIEKVVDFATKTGKDFTLVTPIVTNLGLEKVKALEKSLFRIFKDKAFEVVLNDWGLLRFFQGFNCSLSIGRLLLRQKTDPRLAKIIDRIPSKDLEKVSGVSFNKEMAEFLFPKRVSRIEIDNPLHGLCSFESQGMLVSLHFPFGLASVSRTCHYLYLSRGIDTPLRQSVKCNRQCENGFVNLKNKFCGIELLLKGNSIFFYNGKIPPHEYLVKNNINRFVFQPFLLSKDYLKKIKGVI